MNSISKKVYALTLSMAMSIALIQPAVQAAEAVKPTAAVSESIVSKATQTLQQLGYIDGTTDGMKETATPITRAEAAIILQRVLELDAPATLTGFADVLSDHAAKTSHLCAETR